MRVSNGQGRETVLAEPDDKITSSRSAFLLVSTRTLPGGMCQCALSYSITTLRPLNSRLMSVEHDVRSVNIADRKMAPERASVKTSAAAAWCTSSTFDLPTTLHSGHSDPFDRPLRELLQICLVRVTKLLEHDGDVFPAGGCPSSILHDRRRPGGEFQALQCPVFVADDGGDPADGRVERAPVTCVRTRAKKSPAGNIRQNSGEEL